MGAFATDAERRGIAMVVQTGPEEFNVRAMPGSRNWQWWATPRAESSGGQGADVSN